MTLKMLYVLFIFEHSEGHDMKIHTARWFKSPMACIQRAINHNSHSDGDFAACMPIIGERNEDESGTYKLYK